MKYLALRWPCTIIVSSFAVTATTFVGLAVPLRPLIALWFLLICPGMAFVDLFTIQDRFAKLTLAVTLSISLVALVSGIQLYLGMWSPNVGLVALLCLTLIPTVWQFVTFNNGSRVMEQLNNDTDRE